MKNITFSADGGLIEKARARARAKDTTLNEEFRKWLAEFSNSRGDFVADFDALMEDLKYVDAGRKYSRDEMNERR